MNLTEKPEVIDWPTSHYLFIEKIGPFSETAQKAWQEFHAHFPNLPKDAKIRTMASLYQIQPQMVYRAGVMLSEKPSSVPEGLKYERFDGGRYARFVLMGSYAQLPQASGRVFEIVRESKLPTRSAYFIENYANDPKTTPEADLRTEILIPTK